MNCDKPEKPDRRRVKVVRSQYQPTKDELEEEVDLSHLEGVTVDDMAQAVLEPVEIKYISSPTTAPKGRKGNT